MARGRVDYRQLQRIQKNFQKLADTDMDRFCEKAAKDLAARLLYRVIKRTPVGVYDDGTVGGTLRRGWGTSLFQSMQAEAPEGTEVDTSEIDVGQSIYAIAKGLRVNRYGNIFEIEVVNPVEYASYVEYGHRTRNHRGWVPGKFMMTISAQEVEELAPKMLEKRLMKLLKGAFEGD